jgi:hypothetical protein
MARDAAVLASMLLLIGGILTLVPYLLHKEKAVVDAPTARAAVEHAEFTLPAHQRACMSSITITPDSRLARFQVEAAGSSSASPSIALLLSAPGYRTVAHLNGESEGPLPITPPEHPVIGTVCFLNTGTNAVELVGSREPRATARAVLSINGRPTAGDIALTFLDNRQRSRLSRLGEVFEHASNLTDHLIPAWLIWILAIFGALAIPIGILAAFYRALAEDDLAAGT